jgi:probable HAF family extracellular repeat protein
MQMNLQRLFVIILIHSIATCAAAAAQYYVTDLGTLGGSFDLSNPLGLNAKGQVVGESYNQIGLNGFLWSPNSPNSVDGSIFDLGDLPGGAISSSAKSVNSLGQITGRGAATTGTRAFLWSPNSPNGSTGSMIDLGELPGGSNSSSGEAINSFGQVVGTSSADTGGAYLWTPTTPNGTVGSMVNLGSLPDSSQSNGRGINRPGQVVGGATVPNGIHAFLWSPNAPNSSDGSMVDLGDLPGGTEDATAFAINDVGQVVGYGHAPSGVRAFLWSPNSPNGSTGSTIDLGDLPGGSDSSDAFSINSIGQVVGWGSTPAGQRAFVWSPATPNGSSGNMADLNTMLDPVSGSGWELRAASQINDYGQISGTGLHNPNSPDSSPRFGM